MCRLLRISRATVYRHKAISTPTATVIENNQPKHILSEENVLLRDEIEKIVLKHHWWGYRRVQKQLARQGVHVNRKRVLRVMQLEKLICKRKKRFVPKTTDSNHAFRCYPNLLEKHKPQGLDEVWHADLTYIRVKESFVYLACVLLAHEIAPVLTLQQHLRALVAGGLFALDGFSRKIVGYAISIFMDSMLVLEALQMALKSRMPAPGLIHHSDRGSQYASEKYIRMLEKHGVHVSMSRVGMATDNAKREQPASDQSPQVLL